MARKEIMIPKIGIVLINYKDYAKRFLADCRDGLRVLDYPKDKYITYIVDNATSSGSQAYLKEMYPEAVVIPNSENSGWGGGNNLGIEQAFKDECEDIVLANMDTIVDKDWLKELVEAAYSDAKIGIIQSKLLLHPIGADGIQRINSLGNEIHFLGFGYCRGYGESDKNNVIASEPRICGASVAIPNINGIASPCYGGARNDSISDIPYASGASMYIKGEVFKKVGLCNPGFFMYHDDLEICLKAKLAGYRVVLAPESIIWHKYEFGRSVRQLYFMERNRLITVLEFYKWSTLVLLAPAFLVMELGLLLSSLVGRYARPKMKSWLYFLHFDSWKKIFTERRKIQSSRRLSDRQLMKDFTGKILFQEVENPILNYFVNPVFNTYWQVAKKLIFW